ncbi:MAG: isocitrate/isopropylmalate family dehydrogenase [Rhodococcus sp. (in: high G+C Gram-positive bacteria)]|uniref:isocitrate/isopropylmalate dehydrogenase family protein n=1 Tax=Rhodococcus sp. TaxID=1831 RepID=UPI002AD9A8EC|nr:isocitrate/isopropylmalate family dehydrogenase [Rhodococcus sp. (in: high G+C Gram-positive bacteria)]
MQLAVLPGDGIGPDVINAALPVIETVGLPWALEYGDVGWECWRSGGDPVPPQTWELLGKTDTCLLGAITSKPAREAEQELPTRLRVNPPIYRSPVIQLRQNLGLYANVRPIRDLRNDQFNFVVIRENTEGLYAGLDFRPVPADLWEHVRVHPNAADSGREETAATIRLQTRTGIERLVRFGFAYAHSHGFDRVTVADKPNVLRASSTLLRGIVESIAEEHPEIEVEILNVDALALWMVTRPERFGVILAENMFGDILSDLGAGIMGGLGLAPSANLGSSGSYFEPVHGSAPKMAGTGRANPLATILTIAEIAEHHDFPREATTIRSAVRTVVERRHSSDVTYDLGGTATTTAAANAVLKEIER